MKQYCRYCAFCFEADDFRCSHYPYGEEPHFTREQINRPNHCNNYILSELGDVETGKQYHPQLPSKSKRNDGRQVCFEDLNNIDIDLEI